MTERIGDVVIIEAEPETVCARCKLAKETRPVLADGTRLCFSCATSEEKQAYGERLFGGGAS